MDGTVFDTSKAGDDPEEFVFKLGVEQVHVPLSI